LPGKRTKDFSLAKAAAAFPVKVKRLVIEFIINDLEYFLIIFWVHDGQYAAPSNVGVELQFRHIVIIAYIPFSITLSSLAALFSGQVERLVRQIYFTIRYYV